MNVMGFIIVAVAGFIFFCAYQDYDWYMLNPRSRMLVERIGRSKARKYHMGLSGAMMVVGLLVVFLT